MRAFAAAAEPWDYPAEDDVAETWLHYLIRTLLVSLVTKHLEDQGVRAFTGSEQFIYWQRGNPHKALAPDLYVVLGEDPAATPRVWKTWEGAVPALVVEIVSEDVHKDYELAPMRYAEMGVTELIVFDPLALSDPATPERVRWQVYRRDASGELVQVEVSDGDRVRSVVLGCHVRTVIASQDGQCRVRLATGPGGEDLVATGEEAERTRRIALEAELTALREQLAQRDEDR